MGRGEIPITVATYNTLSDAGTVGGGFVTELDLSFKPRFEQIIRNIMGLDWDFVGLQELDTRHIGKWRDRLFHEGCALLTTTEKGPICVGLVLREKDIHRIRNVRQLKTSGRKMLLVDIALLASPGTTIRIIVGHFKSGDTHSEACIRMEQAETVARVTAGSPLSVLLIDANAEFRASELTLLSHFQDLIPMTYITTKKERKGAYRDDKNGVVSKRIDHILIKYSGRVSGVEDLTDYDGVDFLPNKEEPSDHVMCASRFLLEIKDRLRRR